MGEGEIQKINIHCTKSIFLLPLSLPVLEIWERGPGGEGIHD
jgi:hypothetical protein